MATAETAANMHTTDTAINKPLRIFLFLISFLSFLIITYRIPKCLTSIGRSDRTGCVYITKILLHSRKCIQSDCLYNCRYFLAIQIAVLKQIAKKPHGLLDKDQKIILDRHVVNIKIRCFQLHFRDIRHKLHILTDTACVSIG